MRIHRRFAAWTLPLALIALFALTAVRGAHSLVRPAGWYSGSRSEEKPGVDRGAFVGLPYLQLGNVPLDDSTARVDVLWHTTTDEAAWSVEFREASATSWKKTANPSFRVVDIQDVPAHRIYDATIGGLAPGRLFDFRVLKNNVPVFAGEATAKSSEKQAYRFVLFGDCGANTPSQKKVAYQAYLQKPNFIFIPGDIVYGGGRVSEYRTNFFSIYDATEASPEAGAPLLSSTTMIAAPGNHDTEEERDEEAPDVLAYFLYWAQPLNGPPLRPGGPNAPVPPAAKFQSNFAAAAGRAFPTMENFSFDWGNSHWTVLDSNDYVDWNDAALRKWVEDDLKQAQKKTWRFVAFHHPGFNSSKAHFRDQWMRSLSDIFQAEKVDVVFSGHVHNYQRSLPLRFDIAESEKPGKTAWSDLTRKAVEGTFSLDTNFDGITRTHPSGIIYIVSGAGGQTLYNPEQQSQPESWQKFTAKFISQIHSFTVVDIHGKELSLKQVSEDGEVLDQIRVTK